MTDKIKVLGISASPRAVEIGASSSDQMLNRLLLQASEFGGDPKKIVLASKSLAPCKGCYSENPRNCTYPCALEDDTNEILSEIMRADALALATPVYWGFSSSHLSLLLEKLTALENNRWEITDKTGRDPLEGKPFAILASQLIEGATLMMSQVSNALVQMGMFPVPYGLIFRHSHLEKRSVRIGLRLLGERRFMHADVDIRLAARNLVGLASLIKDANYRFDDDAQREKEW